jgi:D-hexose-6-phosphate mutarotase
LNIRVHLVEILKQLMLQLFQRDVPNDFKKSDSMSPPQEALLKFVLEPKSTNNMVFSWLLHSFFCIGATREAVLPTNDVFREVFFPEEVVSREVEAEAVSMFRKSCTKGALRRLEKQGKFYPCSNLTMLMSIHIQTTMHVYFNVSAVWLKTLGL